MRPSLWSRVSRSRFHLQHGWDKSSSNWPLAFSPPADRGLSKCKIRWSNEVNLSMKLIALKSRCNANLFKCQFLPDYSENAFMLAYFKVAQGRNYI